MGKKKHTPTPWTYEPVEENIFGADGRRVGRFHAGRNDHGNDARPRKVDREFIFRAVNNHDELVDALSGLISAADYMNWPQNHEVWQKARVALDRAREESE